MSTSYPVQRRNSGTKDSNFFALEEDRMTSVGFNFQCGRPRGVHPSSPIHIRSPEHDILPSVLSS